MKKLILHLIGFCVIFGLGYALGTYLTPYTMIVWKQTIQQVGVCV